MRSSLLPSTMTRLAITLRGEPAKGTCPGVRLSHSSLLKDGNEPAELLLT